MTLPKDEAIHIKIARMLLNMTTLQDAKDAQKMLNDWMFEEDKISAELYHRDLPLPHEFEMLESAWGIIANAYHDDWNRFANSDWRNAATKWREKYHGIIATHYLTASPNTEIPDAQA
jgi:hypothetical protein